MEQTIEQLQNLIMEKTIAYGLEDRAIILRELEEFCSHRADEALKMEYDFTEETTD